MTENRKIVLIPRMPNDFTLDLVFKTDRGLAVQASDDDIQRLRDRNIPFVELFSSGNEYAAMMMNSTRDQAIAAIESTQQTALAALSLEDQNEFGIA